MQAEKTDAAIRWEGVSVLMDALGPVDAERFIARMNRDSFDCTEWRRTFFDGMSVRTLFAAATEYKSANPPEYGNVPGSDA